MMLIKLFQVNIVGVALQKVALTNLH